MTENEKKVFNVLIHCDYDRKLKWPYFREDIEDLAKKIVEALSLPFDSRGEDKA